MGGQRPGAPVLTLVEPEPPKGRKRKRVPNGFDPTDLELGVLTNVHIALWDAKGVHGMARGPKPQRPSRTNSGRLDSSPGFLGRLRELVEAGEPNPTELLCAVVRAKLADQAARTDSDPRKQRKFTEGAFAKGTTMCRDAYWEGNVNLARAQLEREDRARRPPPRPQAVEPPPPERTAAEVAAEVDRVENLIPERWKR